MVLPVECRLKIVFDNKQAACGVNNFMFQMRSIYICVNCCNTLENNKLISINYKLVDAKQTPAEFTRHAFVMTECEAHLSLWLAGDRESIFHCPVPTTWAFTIQKRIFQIWHTNQASCMWRVYLRAPWDMTIALTNNEYYKRRLRCMMKVKNGPHQ